MYTPVTPEMCLPLRSTISDFSDIVRKDSTPISKYLDQFKAVQANPILPPHSFKLPIPILTQCNPELSAQSGQRGTIFLTKNLGDLILADARNALNFQTPTLPWSGFYQQTKVDYTFPRVPAKKESTPSTLTTTTYVPNWSPTSLLDTITSALSTLISGFASIVPDTTDALGLRMIVSFASESEKTMSSLTSAKAQALGTKSLMAIGGWNNGDDSNWVQATATPSRISNTTTALIDYCNVSGHKGIDIDWEYPDTPAEITQFNNFVQYAYPLFKAAGLLLTCAVNVNNTLITEANIQYLDRVHIMAYDMGNPHSSLADVTNLMDTTWFNVPGITRTKLFLGLPAYGWNYYTDPQSSMSFVQIWNTYGNTSLNVDKQDAVTYNGIPTIINKCHYARLQGLGGVFFWDYSQDFPLNDVRSLHKAAAETIGLPTPSSYLPSELLQAIGSFDSWLLVTGPTSWDTTPEKGAWLTIDFNLPFPTKGIEQIEAALALL